MTGEPGELRVVVYYCRTYVKAVARGGDVCYGMLRAAACVDESDHHALCTCWCLRTQVRSPGPTAWESNPKRQGGGMSHQLR